MIALIVNPFAGRGAARARALEVERALQPLGDVQCFETREAGNEARCAQDALSAGATTIAVVGGDGSVHHTVRGLLAHPNYGAHSAPLAIFAAGTGNDFVKSLGTPSHDVDALVARIAAGASRLVDVGVIGDVPFVNAAGLGFDVEVLERMQQVRFLTGTAAYVVTALRALLGYKGYEAGWRSAANTRVPKRHLLTVFANGATFGGTFRIAPHAQLDDGVLELVDIAALSPLARPGVFLRAIRGTHLTHPSVTHERGSAWTITSEQPLHFEADGERYVASGDTLDIRVMPRTLRVVT